MSTVKKLKNQWRSDAKVKQAYDAMTPEFMIAKTMMVNHRSIATVNVKLSETLVEAAERHGILENCSVPQQIEYWVWIGKIAVENPDLPFNVIRDILISDQEEPVGEYRFYSGTGTTAPDASP